MADKLEKSNKLKARLPRGLADRGPAELAATRAMTETIRGVFERYGFEAVETPAIEYTDALGKFLPDEDRPNEGVFSFQDDDEQWLSLRYDLTAPLARYVAENFDQLPKPHRSYRYGWVFRNEKPGPGRYRQFMQFDADTVGSSSMAADAEMCMLAADTMEALGIPRGSYVVKVNNRKLLDGIQEAIGLGTEVNTSTRLTVLRAIDKYDRLGRAGVEELLGRGRLDESGDFTKGAGLQLNQIQIIMRLITAIPAAHIQPAVDKFGQQVVEIYANEKFEPPKNRLINNTSTIDFMEANLPFNPRFKDGIAELRNIASLVGTAGYESDRIVVDPSIVRGLEYYTGPVYEVGLTFPIKGDDGKEVRFGSVGGGGRYDGLVARFRNEPVPATGFSIGVSRLAAALQHLGKIPTTAEAGPVVVTVFDQDRIADYQRMVASLRNAGIRAELYLGQGKFGPQMKYADRRRSPCVVIQGSDEKNDPAGPQVMVKDLIVGAELSKLEKGREEHLQKQAEAQRKVPESELVAAVRAVLARHGVK
jgi:histidyl-tRNA synthetase